MAVQAFIIAVIAALAALGVMALWSRWRASRTGTRPLDGRLEPESRFVIRLSDSEVVCERPDGKIERVAWGELQKVEILTTSDGPFAPDVYWLLHGIGGGCAVPQGATGDKALLERLQALPGFDNRPLIEAMASTSDRRFLCWQRPA